jgi:type VI secretion system protein ImpK
MAKNLKGDISRSMLWLRGSLSLAPAKGPDSGLDVRTETQNPVRDIFSDLMAYVLLFLGSQQEQRLSLVEVRGKITHLIDEQEKKVAAGAIPSEAYQAARFAVLSWVDEMILTSSWPERNRWQHLMSTYHGTLNAGEGFFDQLDQLPSAARDVREMYYVCLKLGFLGKLAMADSSDQVAALRHSLYRQLSGSPNDIRQSYSRLFPEAYRPPQVEKRPAPSRIRLLWFGLAILVPVLLFGIYWYSLRQQSNRLLARLEQVPVAVTPPAPVDWATSLIEELRRKEVDVQDAAKGVVITLPGVLFQVNSSALSGVGERKLEDIALVVKRYAPERTVAVEGHASREPGTLDERNQRLSEDRARQAADVLVRSGLRRDKVSAKGLGSSSPVAGNDTEEGRRRNRRVEIIVEKAGGQR